MKNVFYILLPVLLSCNSSTSQKTTKELQSNEVNEGKIEEWKVNKYRNFKHKFRIEFPENYSYDNGTTINTVARSYNKQFGVTFSVLVIETNLKNDYPSDITKIQSVESVKSEFINNDKNLEFNNLKVESCFLNNYPAYCMFSTKIIKSGQMKINYSSVQIKCLKDNKIYQISLNMPTDLWNVEYENLYNRVIGSFNFE